MSSTIILTTQQLRKAPFSLSGRRVGDPSTSSSGSRGEGHRSVGLSLRHHHSPHPNPLPDWERGTTNRDSVPIALLSLDIGERHVGVALATGEPLIPVRHSVIDRVSQDFTARVAALVAQERITTVVVGLPRNLDGEETSQTAAVRADMVLLRAVLPEHVTMSTVDETLTSVEARSRLQQEGESLDFEHAEAAKIILEDFLRSRDNKAEHHE